MNNSFAETLKKLRSERGISQIHLGERMFVTQSTVARWENGTRLPDAAMLFRLSEVLDVDANILLNAVAQSDEHPNVIMVDDNKAILNGGLPILEEVLPNASVTGFTKPSETVEYAKANRIALAVLDIELGAASGLDLCRSLLEINPRTNVVYLTAFPDYSLDAWSTGACGYMLKPITPDRVKEQLRNLRYPFLTGGEGA